VLGISGEAIMGLIGPGGAFVRGNGALGFLLLAEVAAAAAVVSEAALVYIARYKNLAISLAMIGIQAALTFIFVSGLKRAGYPELYQAAGPAMALACSLAFGSLAKSLLASRLLGARVSVWRWPLLIAISATVLLSQIIIRLPEWVELAFGLPAMLALYGWVIWKVGFGEEDRLLFKRTKD
jgi:hypothetical protein